MKIVTAVNYNACAPKLATFDALLDCVTKEPAAFVFACYYYYWRGYSTNHEAYFPIFYVFFVPIIPTVL